MEAIPFPLSIWCACPNNKRQPSYPMSMERRKQWGWYATIYTNNKRPPLPSSAVSAYLNYSHNPKCNSIQLTIYNEFVVWLYVLLTSWKIPMPINKKSLTIEARCQCKMRLIVYKFLSKMIDIYRTSIVGNRHIWKAVNTERDNDLDDYNQPH